MVIVKKYLWVILRGWWLILPTLLVSATSALVFSYSQTPTYQTSATFVVSPSVSFGEFDDFNRSLDTLTKRDAVMSTYAEIATSRAVVGEAKKELGDLVDQVEHLDVSSEFIHSTNILKITAESNDPVVAKTFADLVGQKTISYVAKLYEVYDMKSLDPAYTPSRPSKPDIMNNFMLAVILGLGAGVGAAFLLEYLRSSGETIATVSIIDSDTGVYNRYYFMQRLGEELSRAKRHKYPLSLALVNIENLDNIGSMRLTHLRNEALRRVGLFLKQHMREEDMVARFESDQFALLLPDTSGSEAEQLLKNLQTRMNWTIFELEEFGVKLNLSTSSGIVTYDFNGTGRDELLDRAKMALQRADENGHDKVYLFNNDVDTHQNGVTVGK